MIGIKSINRELYALREKYKITQRDLAEYLGVYPEEISDVEVNGDFFPQDWLPQIQEFFDLDERTMIDLRYKLALTKDQYVSLEDLKRSNRIIMARIFAMAPYLTTDQMLKIMDVIYEQQKINKT